MIYLPWLKRAALHCLHRSTPDREELRTQSNLGRAFAVTVSLICLITGAWAAEMETEVDPGSVSEGLKAIFHYGPGTKETGTGSTPIR